MGCRWCRACQQGTLPKTGRQTAAADAAQAWLAMGAAPAGCAARAYTVKPTLYTPRHVSDHRIEAHFSLLLHAAFRSGADCWAPAGAAPIRAWMPYHSAHRPHVEVCLLGGIPSCKRQLPLSKMRMLRPQQKVMTLHTCILMTVASSALDWTLQQ